MRLDQLHPAPGAKKGPKRVGRGPGSGHGKTAGKGHKGQKARSGGGKGPGFEGGQMPLYRRVPKRGFVPRARRVYAPVNLKSLGAFTAGSVVDPDRLVEAGLIKKAERGSVKLLGEGELDRTLTVKVHAISAAAKQKVEAAGGTVEVLPA
ncbi:MAG: 50S ribosomal protein L15 [Candidatus Rokubacteria bacterium]|nr:50S ribosomal protein L15 [Candidatus Rokubacteria bacterium]